LRTFIIAKIHFFANIVNLTCRKFRRFPPIFSTFGKPLEKRSLDIKKRKGGAFDGENLDTCTIFPSNQKVEVFENK